MKAALCKSHDGPDAVVIADIPDPTAGEGEVVVRVRAAALNFFDTLMLRNKYQFKPPLPFSPCAEIAGDIDSVGPGVTGFKAGDRVAASIGHGGAREKAVVKAAQLTRMPDKLAYADGSGLTVVYGTTLHALRDRGKLQPGQTLAVLGASGGVGLSAIELGKIMGARIIACASSPEKLAVCKQHGADVLIDYNKEDLKEALRKATDGKGVDVVYDAVGGPYAEPAIRSMAWEGRFLVIGFAAGEIPKVPFNLMLLKSCDVVGVFWGEWSRRNPKLAAADIQQIYQWAADGKIKSSVHKTYPLERIVDALKAFERREVTGKAVITI
jgi:NADPH2:quinone reductase